MTTLLATATRDVTCAAGSVLITLVLSFTFVQSTAAAPRVRVSETPRVTLERLHGWVGQPEPAVLVD
jgi:hypothetical protein